jgi:hypothetical protein
MHDHEDRKPLLMKCPDFPAWVKMSTATSQFDHVKKMQAALAKKKKMSKAAQVQLQV